MTIFVYHYSITPSLFPERLIHSKKHKLFIFYPRSKTVFHHNFIVYTISTLLFKYYVIIFFNAIYLLRIVPFLYFVYHVFHFLFPHLDTCRSKLYMYNNHVVTTSFSYSTAIYMYYTPEVTLLYPCVMLHLIKHANLLGGFPYHFK